HLSKSSDTIAGFLRRNKAVEKFLKKAILLILVLLTVLTAVLFIAMPGKKIRSSEADVVVTTFALYDVARHLLEHDAQVQMLIPFGQDVHTFEPTPRDMIRVEKSRLFLYSGAGLEPWASHFVELNHAVDMSGYVRLREGGHAHHEEAHAGAEDGAEDHAEVHHHEPHAYDPHYWLDIDNMKALVRVMETRFIQAFPALDAGAIHGRAEAYVKRLDTLDGLYRKRLSECRLDTIVVSHNAFGYLAARYGFRVAALTGLSPDTMPDAKTMAQLSDLVQEKGVKTLFYESFVSDKLAVALARESGVKVDVLQPLANITAEEIGADYFRLMNANLLKLHDALECR
ncbi:MAG: metal ABC transporter substrate-binding protein, partial [Campylobacterales bacterium]